MKNSVRTVLAYLVVGTSASIAVAWGSSAFPHKTMPPTVPLDAPNAHTRWYGGSSITPMASYVWRSPTWIDQENFFGKAPISSLGQTHLSLPYWSRLNHPISSRQRNATNGFAEIEEARGWPFRCLVGYTQMYIDLSKGGWVAGEQHWVINIKSTRWKDGPHAILPLRPIPFGFIVDALIYSCASWFVVVGPGRLRRYIRVRLGHCEKCGYDLRGTRDKGCPECGSRR